MASNKIQVKRTAVSGRTPNTTNVANSQYIVAGEFALNMVDGILYTSNGSGLITIGANNVDVNISNTLTIKTISANGSVGTANQVLTSNGSVVYWTNASGGGAIGGTNTQIIFNDSGSANGSAGLTFDKSTYNMTVGNSSTNCSITNTSVIVGVDHKNQTIMYDDYTVANTYNAFIVGPYTVTTGKTLAIANGARMVIL